MPGSDLGEKLVEDDAARVGVDRRKSAAVVGRDHFMVVNVCVNENRCDASRYGVCDGAGKQR